MGSPSAFCNPGGAPEEIIDAGLIARGEACGSGTASALLESPVGVFAMSVGDDGGGVAVSAVAAFGGAVGSPAGAMFGGVTGEFVASKAFGSR